MKVTRGEQPYLSPVHAEMIRKSAIAPEVAAARGYRTVERPELMRLGFARVQALPGLLVPMYGPQGKPVLWQVRPDKPRPDPKKPEKVVKYETPMGKGLRIDFPPSVLDKIKNADEPLTITEGVRKADAVASLGMACISIIGVDGWRGTRSDGDKGPLEDLDHIPFLGRLVYLGFDSDVMTKNEVRAALHRLTSHLALSGAKVRWLRLKPGPETLTGQRAKVGLDDYLSAGGDFGDLIKRSVKPGKLPVRVNGRSLPDLTRDAIAALAHRNDPPTVFRRGDDLVERRTVGVKPMTLPRLRYRLSEAGNWHRTDKDGNWTATNPPIDAVQNVTAADDLWPFPHLDRIVSTPVFAGDGSLRSEPGYHAPSRSLYVPPAGLVVPRVKDKPTAESVRKAKAWIEKLFAEFPFVDQADRAHAWAMLLQPFAREMIRGATPMYSVEAPRQSTGKTCLVKSALAPAVGEVATNAAPHGDEEMEKKLTTFFRQAEQVVLFDNVKRRMGYPSLASALTSQTWQGRVLGQSETIQAPILCTWVMTANNPTFDDDMPRRTIPLRLDTGLENPHHRSDFKLSLPAWALEHRGELIWAACTLIRSWVVDGRPAPPKQVPSLGSYGPWRRVLGGVLHHHGIPGFLGNLAKAEPSGDQETLSFLADYCSREFESWFTMSVLASRLFYEGVAELEGIHGRDVEQFAQSLGYFFRAHRGQVVGDLVLERSEKRQAAGYGWRFGPVKKPAV